MRLTVSLFSARTDLLRALEQKSKNVLHVGSSSITWMLSFSDRFRFHGHTFFRLVRRKRIELRARLTNGHPFRQPGRPVSNPCVPFNEFSVNGDVIASSVDYGRLRLCLKPWRTEPCPLSGQKPVVSTVGCAPWQEVTPTATTSTLRQAQVQVQSVLWTATTVEQRGAASLSVELTQQGNGVCHFVV